MEQQPIKKIPATEYVPTYAEKTTVEEEQEFYRLQKAIQRYEASEGGDLGESDFYGKYVDFAGTLMQQYPDIRDYSLFHILTGSTPPEGTPKIDIEGKDSILAFMRELVAQHQIPTE